MGLDEIFLGSLLSSALRDLPVPNKTCRHGIRPVRGLDLASLLPSLAFMDLALTGELTTVLVLLSLFLKAWSSFLIKCNLIPKTGKSKAALFDIERSSGRILSAVASEPRHPNGPGSLRHSWRPMLEMITQYLTLLPVSICPHLISPHCLPSVCSWDRLQEASESYEGIACASLGVCFVFFSDRVLLYSPGWPGTWCLAQVGLKLTKIVCFCPLSSGIKACRYHHAWPSLVFSNTWFLKVALENVARRTMKAEEEAAAAHQPVPKQGYEAGASALRQRTRLFPSPTCLHSEVAQMCRLSASPFTPLQCPVGLHALPRRAGQQIRNSGSWSPGEPAGALNVVPAEPAPSLPEFRLPCPPPSPVAKCELLGSFLRQSWSFFLSVFSKTFWNPHPLCSGQVVQRFLQWANVPCFLHCVEGSRD